MDKRVVISIHAPREGGDLCPECFRGRRRISIHAPREGGDVDVSPISTAYDDFNPRPPRGGRLCHHRLREKASIISIHAPREGGDSSAVSSRGCALISIHAPREGGDDSGDVQPIQGTDFNPRPPRGGRPQCLHHHFFRICISIHAPREGGDVTMYQLPPDIQPISIHAPREGGDVRCQRALASHRYFNPRPPRGGRHQRKGKNNSGITISIHAPREGGDENTTPHRQDQQQFQSTPPARGATGGATTMKWEDDDFNPRPPRGGRLLDGSTAMDPLLFQSTPPARGATRQFIKQAHNFTISIHAPREGGDAPHTRTMKQHLFKFQSTPPARGATNRLYLYHL